MVAGGITQPQTGGARLVPTTALHVADWNPRTIDEPEFAAVVRSLQADPQFLWNRPICAMADGTVYAGAQRLKAADALGPEWQREVYGAEGVPADVGDVDEVTARKRALIDNNHAGRDQADLQRQTFDFIRLRGGDLDTLGVSPDRIARMQAALPRRGPIPDADPEALEVPDALQAKWATAEGDVWEVPSRSMPGARHRLAQGDARTQGAISRLMGPALASMVWTDPPYGVDYEGGTGLDIAGDTPEGLLGLLTAAFGTVDAAVIDSAPFYVAHPAGPLSMTFLQAIQAAGWRLHQTLVWIKPRLVLGHSDYHYAHEPLLYGETRKHRRGPADGYAADHTPIYYGWTAGEGTPARGRAGSRWYGGDAQTTVLTVDRPQRSAMHPTMKPPDLIARCIGNSSRPGEIVLDPFLGSGSTVIAAEASARLGYGLELEPRYLATALERLAQSGLTPERVSPP